jgi:glycosyltransferase involved in cell wall biosynthesis
MFVTILSASAFVLAAVPAILYFVNCRLYRPAPRAGAGRPSVSVLIPARNEEANIGLAIEAALASRGVDIEVIILDDESEDRTAAFTLDYAKRDPRVRLVRGEPLPAGWCGKQYACHQLAGHARYPILVFTDADVRLEPDALGRLAAFLNHSKADLVSGIPREETRSSAETIVIPLIHFLLLGYLPIFAMRRTRWSAFGAACGQLIAARRESYEAIGGHAAVRASRHDGVTLPRAYRRRGLATDLCDATDLAVCRMYRGFRDLWFGLAKNAAEGLAHPAALFPWTVLLFGGQVLPWVLIVCSAWLEPAAAGLAAMSVSLSLAVRVHAAARFRQAWLGALLHPAGVSVLLAIQWYSAARALFGRPITWKGRAPSERPNQNPISDPAPGLGRLH